MKNSGFICLLIAAAGDLIVPFLLAPFAKNYSHKTMVLSSLGSKSCSVHVIYNAWLVIAGVLFAIGAIALYREFSPISKGLSIGLTVCILGFGLLACLLSAFFSVGETKELITLSAKIHGIGAVLGFLMLVISPLLLGIISLRSGSAGFGVFSVFSVFSIASFVLAFVCYVLLAMADKPQFAGTPIAWEGMWEHLCLLFAYLPMIALSVRKLFENLSV